MSFKISFLIGFTIAMFSIFAVLKFVPKKFSKQQPLLSKQFLNYINKNLLTEQNLLSAQHEINKLLGFYKAKGQLYKLVMQNINFSYLIDQRNCLLVHLFITMIGDFNFVAMFKKCQLSVQFFFRKCDLDCRFNQQYRVFECKNIKIEFYVRITIRNNKTGKQYTFKENSMFSKLIVKVLHFCFDKGVCKRRFVGVANMRTKTETKGHKVGKFLKFIMKYQNEDKEKTK